MNKTVLKADRISKRYSEGGLNVEVLHQVNFQIQKGESCAITGVSGAGKSTFLHLLGGLDKPDSGKVEIVGESVAGISEKKLGLLRNQSLGFVYQFHHLLPEFSVMENIAMPLVIGGMGVKPAQKQALEIAKEVGLEHRTDHRPFELSGGERQRVAIARAVANEPDCILADEPTGNLDETTAQSVFEMLLTLKQQLGTALVVVTHDQYVAQLLDQRYELRQKALHPVS